jgi:hypothetical protein
MSLPKPAAGPLPVSPRILLCLRGLLALLSVALIVLFVVSALKRLHYPSEYDWIEDGMLASVRHIAAGLPLYQAPTVTFTPYLYTPIYFYAVMAMAHFTGLGYAALRLVSIVSTLGCFAVIYGLVFSESRRHLAALAAAGLFAACYAATGNAFDIGRVDMLYLFFVLCAFYSTRRLNPIVAAIFWVLAFQTKQGVLPIAVLALCYDWHRPRRIALGLGAFIAGLGGSILWLNHISNGWYKYYVFGMAGGFGYNIQRIVRFLPTDVLSVCGIAVLIIFAAILATPTATRNPLQSPAFNFYFLGSIGMIAFTFYIRIHRGANENSLLPMYAWFAILFGLAMGRLFTQFETRATHAAFAAYAILLLAASSQILLHIYTTSEYGPLPREFPEREGFLQQIRSIPGDVLVLGHPEDGLLAGKTLYAGSESIGAVIEAHNQGPGDALVRQYTALLHSGQLKAIVLDMTAEQFLDHPRVWMPSDFLTLYPLRVKAVGSEDFRFTSEPQWIYLPCSGLATAIALDPHVDTTHCPAR